SDVCSSDLSGSTMFGDRNEKDDGRECQRREGEFGSRRECSRKANPTPLRNEAQLNCVSLRSELKYEVSWGVVKGQDERPVGAPLTASQLTTGGLCRSENN